MLFHPAVLALLLIDGIGLALLLLAAGFGWQVVRGWDLASGSAQQIRLERRVYLMNTVLQFVFAGQILALLLFVFTADALANQFVGAMCAVGTLNVNPWGFTTLFLKLALFFLAAAWLVMTQWDQRAPDYPLIRARAYLLLAILPVALAAVVSELVYFGGLRAEVITSCCGSLFGRDSDIASEVGPLSPWLTMVVFYSTLSLVIASGMAFLRRGVGIGVFAALSVLAFFVAIAAVITFVSPYLYEHPHHHCPFCLLKSEYDYVGYALYLPLFGATALGSALALTLPFARAESLKPIVAVAVPRLVRWATGLFGIVIAVVTWIVLRSNLVLLS